LSIVETQEDGSAKVRRRRLSQDDERAIARLYAETRTPTAEIRERFGIGESSLYRVVQRHGVALRGRTGPSTTLRSSAPSPKATPAKAAPAKAAPAQDSPAQHRVRIRFQAETVFEATDLRDALRQAESLGATDITAVARVN